MSLDETARKKLLDEAIAIRGKAHAPYSGYKVGAALLVAGVQESVVGCNVENGSYGLTNCAERTAIFSAVAKHGPKEITAIAISVLPAPVKPGEPAPPPPGPNDLSPCGACRQVMAEFMKDGAEVFVDQGDGAYKRYTMDQLLLDAFRIPGKSIARP
jgi:cytidine deaminase